jgi:HK97 family phage prohead protease
MVTTTALRSSTGAGISLIKSSNDLVIAGYASVEMVDKQGDLITRGALKSAFGDFMKAQNYRNVQLAHSNIQVGEVINSYTDTDGRLWKSGVDDAGMFVVIQLRDDIEKAREVANEIRKGNLTGFSIGGQAFKRVNKSDQKHGSYTEISKLELHEVTICEKGINPEATFRILKEDTNMTNETDTLSELSGVLSRLNGRLDALEKSEEEEILEEKTLLKEDDALFEDEEEEEECPEEDEKMTEDLELAAKADSDYSSSITSDYLDWMENTLKSAGVDVGGARSHFDQMNKAQLGGFDNTASVDGASYFRGQSVGGGHEAGNPSAGALATLNGGAKVAKGYLDPEAVSASDIEGAYEVYKAAALEQKFKSSLNGVFADRLQKEISSEAETKAASNFDARGPLSSIEKSLEGLSARIEEIATTSPSDNTNSTIRKSGGESNVEIPSTEDLANMSWDEVHNLAGSVWN